MRTYAVTQLLGSAVAARPAVSQPRRLSGSGSLKPAPPPFSRASRSLRVSPVRPHRPAATVCVFSAPLASPADMSGDHLHNDSQIEVDFRLNDSHKHKDKHKDREHQHREHKKDKEEDLEKFKHSNSEHKDSEKKHKEKEKTKHKDGSSEKHKDKHKDRDKEKRKEEKIKASGDAKIKKEKENGFSSPPRIKDEPEDDGYFASPKEDIKPLKRPRDEDE